MLKNITNIALLFISLNSAFTSNLYAHGEDKPGPNGGYIRMPGAFHVEVVPEKSGDFRIFLLDLGWKNPSVQNSKIDAELIQLSGSSSELLCKPEKEYFLCKSSIGINAKSSELIVKAVRNASKGAPAIYKLPLSYSTSAH